MVVGDIPDDDDDVEEIIEMLEISTRLPISSLQTRPAATVVLLLLL